MLVQALFPESGVERLNTWVIRRGPGPAAGQFDAVAMRPLIQGLGGELRPIIHSQHLGPSVCAGQPFQHHGHPRPTQGSINLDSRTLTGHVIHEREGAKPPPIS
jgi:hypothetical protein